VYGTAYAGRTKGQQPASSTGVAPFSRTLTSSSGSARW
jgi:hypothetical protein